MRFQSYFNTAILIIQQYDGSMPLVHFLKQYFAQHKKHGSKDRKLIAHLCYGYYRLGHALKGLAIEERLKVSLFLCNESSGDWHILYDESWVAKWNGGLELKISFIRSVYPEFSRNHIFPWTDELSEGIETEAFITSHLIQPDLYLRIRPGKEKIVLQKLTDQHIAFKKMGAACLSLPNSSKVDALLEVDKEVVIQDYSSQRIAEFLQLATSNSQLPTKLWDCCAASGGKSILAYDTMPNAELTVSDIRPSILHNLKQRFEKAGIKNYNAFVADIANSAFSIQHSPFTIVLCDAPCTGSGTWSRTPEQLFFFTQEKINEYATLQKKIVNNVMPHITANGYLLYITCSVFKKENEKMVDFILKNKEMELVKMELLKGYDKKADSMFAALFRLRGEKG